MINIEIIKKIKDAFYYDEDGETYTLEFEPALTDQQLAELDARFPGGKVPAALREILKETKGWTGYGIESVFFDAVDEFGFDDLIPHSVTLGGDGSGNFWVLEIGDDGKLGKVFFACHDPAVLVIFADTLDEYLELLEAFYNNPGESLVNEVNGDVVVNIWKTNPNVHEVADFKKNNPSSNAIVGELDDQWVIADLRNGGKKDGFAWGKYDFNLNTRRLGNDLLWALKKKKKGFLSKLFG